MTDFSSDIRKPAVAGMFYPRDPGELARTIAEFFSQTKKLPITDEPIAIIAPHAGYPYSGKVAAKAYKLLEGREYDTVVIISPSHTLFFQGAAVYEGAGYQTPLGVVEIDKDLSEKIGSIHPSVRLSRQGHAVGADRGEHALEVQLPFLQVVLGRFKLVAIVMGDQEEDTVHGLGEALASALRGTRSLIVASTDLSHFHSEKRARKLDSSIREAVEQYSADLLLERIESGQGEACGAGPTAAAMIAARRLGGDESHFVEYATSGESTGDFENVVGYLSAVITAKDRKVTPPEVGTAVPSKDLTEDDKAMLHQIARDAIKAKFENAVYEPPVNERIGLKRGAFVTLKIGGELRGCIGMTMARAPLNQTVAEMAQAAAFEDPRFRPLTEAEFAQIETEISVLTPFARVHDLGEIEVGRDGLMIKLDFHSGLLLPQVASEYGWDRTQFLEQTCLKAGLARNAYKDKYAEIYRFSAEVF